MNGGVISLGRHHLARNYISQLPLQLGVAVHRFLTKEMPVDVKTADQKSRTQLGQFQKIKEIP